MHFLRDSNRNCHYYAGEQGSARIASAASSFSFPPAAKNAILSLSSSFSLVPFQTGKKHHRWVVCLVWERDSTVFFEGGKKQNFAALVKDFVSFNWRFSDRVSACFWQAFRGKEEYESDFGLRPSLAADGTNGPGKKPSDELEFRYLHGTIFQWETLPIATPYWRTF